MADNGKPLVSRDLARRAMEFQVYLKKNKVERAEKAISAARRSLELREKELECYDRDGTLPKGVWFERAMEHGRELATSHVPRQPRGPLVEVVEPDVIPARLGGTQKTAWVEALLAKGAREKKNLA